MYDRAKVYAALGDDDTSARHKTRADSIMTAIGKMADAMDTEDNEASSTHRPVLFPCAFDLYRIEFSRIHML